MCVPTPTVTLPTGQQLLQGTHAQLCCKAGIGLQECLLLLLLLTLLQGPCWHASLANLAHLDHADLAQAQTNLAHLVGL
jgi:hypothetical protein